MMDERVSDETLQEAIEYYVLPYGGLFNAAAMALELQERRAQRCETCAYRYLGKTSYDTHNGPYCCEVHHDCDDYPQGVELTDGCTWWGAKGEKDAR